MMRRIVSETSKVKVDNEEKQFVKHTVKVDEDEETARANERRRPSGL